LHPYPITSTTIITGITFPVFIYVYYRLSKRWKSEMITLLGEEYRKNTEKTPMFVPKLGKGAVDEY